MSNPLGVRPLHLGQIIRHPHFRRNMRKCVRNVICSKIESSFSIYSARAGGPIFTEVIRGTADGMAVPAIEKVLGGRAKREAVDEIISIYYRLYLEKGYVPSETESAQGEVLCFHTHPDKSANPFFSPSDLNELFPVCRPGIRLGLFPVISVGSVYGDLPGQRFLSVLFCQPRGIFEAKMIAESCSKKENWGADQPRDDIRKGIIDALLGRGMFLDFPVRRDYSITVSRETRAEASRMVIIGKRR